jgi:hypothetical protein
MSIGASSEIFAKSELRDFSGTVCKIYVKYGFDMAENSNSGITKLIFKTGMFEIKTE